MRIKDKISHFQKQSLKLHITHITIWISIINYLAALPPKSLRIHL